MSLPLVSVRRGSGARSGGATSAPSTLRRRVLVVDDNRDAAETLAQLVEMLGHEAEVAFDGASALRRRVEHAPEVVLCDIGLPRHERLRGGEASFARRTVRELRLVAVTRVRAARGRRDERQAAGFDAHLAKPMDPLDLERVVEG